MVSIFFILIVLGLIIVFIPFTQSLVFYEKNTSNIEAFLPVEDQDEFQIIFTHSIHMSDVVEKYVVLENQSIQQFEIVYEEFDVGMPANAEEGEDFVYEDDKYHIKNMENLFSEIKIRNGRTVSEHRLVWGAEQEYITDFNNYFAPGDWFTVRIDNLSLWQMIQGVRIHE